MPNIDALKKDMIVKRDGGGGEEDLDVREAVPRKEADANLYSARKGDDEAETETVDW